MLLALASSAVWGTADFGGGMLARRIPALRVVLISQFGSFLVICAVFGVQVARGGLPTQGAWWVWGGLAGLCGAVALGSFYAALSAGTMGVVSPIAALGAVVPVLLGLLGGDSWTPLLGLGLFLALLGAALASGPEVSEGAGSAAAVRLAVVAAFGFGLCLYFLHRASDAGAVPAMWAMRTASVAALCAFAVLSGRPEFRGERLSAPVLLLIVVVGCGDMAANGLYALASQHGAVSVVSVLGSLYPVATIVLAAFVLGERLRPIQIAGVVVALSGVVLAVA